MWNRRRDRSIRRGIPLHPDLRRECSPDNDIRHQTVVDANETLKNAVVDVQVMDGEDLRYDANTFDASVMNFGIFFFPNPAKGAAEAYRTLKPGGIAIFTLWKEFGFKQILWAVQERIKPADPLTELPLMEVWCDGNKIKSALQDGGFTDITMVPVEALMYGTGREDFEKVLIENFGAMVAKNWTTEEKDQLRDVTTQVLDDSLDRFTVKDGDNIGVRMIAWAAVCKK